MYESEEPGPSGAMDRVKKFLVFVVVAGLLAVAGYLQVERNHRTYFTAVKDGALVISKGSYFLWGSRPYVPEDPPEAEAYAPIPLPAGVPPVPAARFAEREELDRFLFDLLAGWAEPRIHTGDPEQLKEGFLYVDRATRLTGVSGTQAKKLRELRAEVAFFEARDRIERAAALLEEARDKLRLASEGSGHAREAAVLLEQIEPANQVVAFALRQARLGIRVEGAAPSYYPVPVTVAVPGTPAPAAPPGPTAGPTSPAGQVGPAGQFVPVGQVGPAGQLVPVGPSAPALPAVRVEPVPSRPVDPVPPQPLPGPARPAAPAPAVPANGTAGAGT